MSTGSDRSSSFAVIGARGTRRATHTLRVFLAGAILLAPARLATAQSSVVSWGACYAGECVAPQLPPGITYIEIAAGEMYSAALLSDGTIRTWGDCSYGVCNVPPLPPGISFVRIAVADSPPRVFGICSDGSMVAWGNSDYGNLDVPPLPAGLTYLQVSAGPLHTVALRSDGSVVAWGADYIGQCAVPPLPPGLSYVEVGAGMDHTVARRSDGSVVAWGYTPAIDVPPLPSGVTYVEVAASGGNTKARCSDGSIVQWGAYLEEPVPPLPPGVSYVEVAAQMTHALARRSDGSAVGWGANEGGQCDVPPPPPGFVYTQVAAGGEHSIAIVAPAPACGSVSAYCWPPAPNSASATGARLTVAGCPGLTANDLVLTVSGLPPHAFGLFCYARSQRQVPFGNGTSCVAGRVQRIQPMMAADAAGVLTYAVDLTRPPFSGGTNPILAGSAYNFQLCYRDPTSPPALFNYSDAAHIAFSP